MRIILRGVGENVPGEESAKGTFLYFYIFFIKGGIEISIKKAPEGAIILLQTYNFVIFLSRLFIRFNHPDRKIHWLVS